MSGKNAKNFLMKFAVEIISNHMLQNTSQVYKNIRNFL
jgi:hypothetical protein